MNHSKKNDFKRSNSFSLRLTYDKLANLNNKKAIEVQKKKSKDSNLVTSEKQIINENNPKGHIFIKGCSFGRRERWQRVKNISEYMEIKDLPKKKIATKSIAKWENFHENSENGFKKPFVRSSPKKAIGNSITSRTLNPEIDSSISKSTNKKHDFPTKLRYRATGSLCNLIECTSNETPRKIANMRKDLGSIIFEPEFNIIHPFKRHKSLFDLDRFKKNTSSAGVKSEITNHEKSNTLHKISNLRKNISFISNIFNTDLNISQNNSLMDQKEKRSNTFNQKGNSSSNYNKYDVVNKSETINNKKNYVSGNLSYSIDIHDNTQKRLAGKNNLNPLNVYPERNIRKLSKN